MDVVGRGGRFNIAVQYFDLQGGVARFAFAVNRQQIVAWPANDTLPTRHPHGDNSTRYVVHGVALEAGDVIRLEGTPDGADPAALDYVEVQSAASAP